jgi:DNA invertase Pin-like site-specific DNA recombinase
MNVAQYVRVSSEEQAKGEHVSIEQQIADIQALCDRNSWNVLQQFIDSENYCATQSPKRGKIVNPSGERADRPAFLAMLEMIKTGAIDAVACWRDDRLVRHPRVAVALEDALDIGDTQRNNQTKIRVFDATGAIIDRFTLSIKATIWREENKRRAERIRMGKVATLKRGRWPGSYHRLGYTTHKAERGRVIEIDEEEAATVRKIHELFDAGVGVVDIRRHLIHNGLEQKGTQPRSLDWNIPAIYKILRAEDYIGVATWNFGDGTSMSIDIPAIISRDLWKRNQARLEQNKLLSTRNAKGIYLLQGLLYCAECDHAMTVCRPRYYYYKGERRKYKTLNHKYHCGFASLYSDEPHPRPYNFSGRELDWAVWRYIVEKGIRHPELIQEQVLARQAELQKQGESVESEIVHARRKVIQIDQERAFYQKQAARGKITESEFDTRMAETEEARKYWEAETDRLRELRDNATKVQAGLNYATELLIGIQRRLPEIDYPPDKLKALAADKQKEVLRERQVIIRALCEKVFIHANRQVRIEGMLDGSESAQFDLPNPHSGRTCAECAPQPRDAR